MIRAIGLACVALAGVLAFLPLQLLDADEAWFAFAAVAVVIALLLLILVIAWRNRPGIAILAVFIAASWLLITSNTTGLRERMRWIVYGTQAKSAVLALPNPPRGQLRHAEWDAWGFAGMDTSIYLVFDPANALQAASTHPAPIIAPALPCAVSSIEQLEPSWYSVQFYTSKHWENC